MNWVRRKLFPLLCTILLYFFAHISDEGYTLDTGRLQKSGKWLGIRGFRWWRGYKKFKFHIICAMRTLIAGSTVVFGQARKQQKICKKLWQVIQDNSEMDRILHAAITCLDSACRVCDNVPVSDQHRSREITLSMIGYAEKQAKAVECSSFLKVGDIVHCTVTAMNLSFVNVAIKTDDARNYGSIHISQLAKKYISDIKDEMTIGQIFQAKIIGEEFNEKWGWELSKLF